MKISCVVFDVSGPVLHEDIFERYRSTLLFDVSQKHGAMPPREEYEKIRRRAIERHVPSISEAVAWDLAKGNVRICTAILRDYRAAIAALTPEKWIELWPPTSGMEGVLPALHGDYTLVLSGNEPEVILKVLDRHGLRRFFKNVLLSHEIGFRKPDPRFFLEVLKRISCPPAETVVVGDSVCLDIQPALLVGIKTIRHHVGWCAWQEVRGPFELPDKVIDSMEELPSILEELRDEA